VDDLMSAAMVGLVTSADRFDPTRGVQFKTFAEQRIRGIIMDELRAQDWLSRPMRDKYKQLERTTAALGQKLGREPASEEIAAALGMELEDYFLLLGDVHAYSFMSLDESWDDGEGNPINLLEVLDDKGVGDPQNKLIRHQLMHALGGVIDELPEKERLVVTLYYYEELTMKEIGHVLTLTESRVSQIHSQAVVRLRARLKIHM
jgi:RNA polymerase sigma factor for flagellar operon FliA